MNDSGVLKADAVSCGQEFIRRCINSTRTRDETGMLLCTIVYRFRCAVNLLTNHFDVHRVRNGRIDCHSLGFLKKEGLF